jgi:ABC-type uncharacterized transport system auxiliary subunit
VHRIARRSLRDRTCRRVFLGLAALALLAGCIPNAPTTVVTFGMNSAPPNGLSGAAVTSDDARVVAYESMATNVVPQDTTFDIDIYAFE